MKRKISILAVVMLCLISVGVVLATGYTSHDSWVAVRSFDPNYTVNQNSDFGLSVSGTSGPSGGCAAVNVTYLKWDLSSVNAEASDNVNPTTLTLVAALSSGGGTLDLHEVLDDTWNETSITGENAPAIGDLIVSVANPGTAGPILFQGANLTSYINEQTSFVGGNDTTAGDDDASFAVVMSGCGQSSQAYFYKDEGSTDAQRPQLDLFGPTAVDFYSFRSGGTADMTMIGLGLLVAVGLLVGTGYTLAKRRRA